MDYSNGKIYKILNTITDDVYVGSTTQPLRKRLYGHKKTLTDNRYDKTKFYCKVRELGFENFYIELIENYACKTREELLAREGKWIREISTLNKLIAGRDSKGYYDDNAEMLKQKAKDFRKQNPEYLKNNNKDYKEKHKERLKEHRKKTQAIKHLCECGQYYTSEHRARHLRSKRHEQLLKENEEDI